MLCSIASLGLNRGCVPLKADSDVTAGCVIVDFISAVLVGGRTKDMNVSITIRKTHRKTILAAATAVAVMLATFVGAPAATAAPAPDSPPAVPEQQVTLSPAEAAELEGLLSASDFAAKSFDPTAAVAAGVEATAIADYATVVAAGGWTISSPASLTAQASESAQLAAVGVAACTGRSGYTGFYGAFWQIALNSCQTESLILAIRGVGGGAAAIGGLLAAIGFPGGAIAAAVGVLIVANPWPLDVCKAASGKHAIYINIFVVGGVGCWGQ